MVTPEVMMTVMMMMVVVVVSHQLCEARAMVRQVRAEVAARGVSTSRIPPAPRTLAGRIHRLRFELSLLLHLTPTLCAPSPFAKLLKNEADFT